MVESNPPPLLIEIPKNGWQMMGKKTSCHTNRSHQLIWATQSSKTTAQQGPHGPVLPIPLPLEFQRFPQVGSHDPSRCRGTHPANDLLIVRIAPVIPMPQRHLHQMSRQVLRTVTSGRGQAPSRHDPKEPGAQAPIFRNANLMSWIGLLVIVGQRSMHIPCSFVLSPALNSAFPARYPPIMANKHALPLSFVAPFASRVC